MGAAEFVGEAYYWGKGVAIDHQRAMVAYKTGAERGDAACQHQVGWMYYNGHGVDVNHKQAREWWEKAAAQDDPEATRCLLSRQDRCLLLGQDRCLLLRQDRCLLLRQDRSLLFRKALALPGRAVTRRKHPQVFN